MVKINQPNAPIGIFDSGFGGLTVMKAIRKLLPNENLIYLGDAARLPYGNKSPDTVIRYTLESAQFLSEQQVKLIIIACHTASSVALSALSKELSIPVIGMIDPCLPGLIHAAHRGAIGILATQGTVTSGVYQTALQEQIPKADIIGIPCPLFVPLVEEGVLTGPIVSEIIKHYLAPLKAKQIQTLLLACTHYPLLKGAIQEFMGPACRLIDPSISCASFIKQVLSENYCLNLSCDMGSSLFFTTDDPDKFKALGPRFLETGIEAVSKALLS
jgi:glutamate racemase